MAFISRAQDRWAKIEQELNSSEGRDRGSGMHDLFVWAKTDTSVHLRALEIFKSFAVKETDPWPALLAVQGIAVVLGEEATRSYRIAMLRHPNVDMAMRMAMSVKDRSYVPELLALLDRRKERELQSATIRTLGRLRDQSAFLPMLARMNNPELVPDIVQAFGDLGDPRALEHLKPYLNDRTEMWPIDNHGPMLLMCDLAQTSMDQINREPSAASQTPAPVASHPPPLPGPSRTTAGATRHPVPTPRKIVFVAYLPLLAVVLEIPWFMIVVVMMLYTTGGAQHSMESHTHRFDLIAMIPVLSGFIASLFAIARWRQLSRPERICVVTGALLCLLTMFPFTFEMLS